MTDLERRLAEAAPTWPEPSPDVERRTRTALGWDTAAAPAAGYRWWRRRRGAGRLLLAGAVLVVGGAVATAAIITTSSGGGSSSGTPASFAFAAPEVAGAPVSWTEGMPRVAVDGGGGVTVVWGRAGRVVVRTREAGGSWAAERVVSRPGQRSAYPAVAADDAGNVVVVWRQRTAGRELVERFTFPGGAPAGVLRDTVDRRWTVMAISRAADGSWSRPEAISPPARAVRDMEQPAVGMTAAGDAVALWDVDGAVWARQRAAGAAHWAPPVRVGQGAGEAVAPVLSVDPSGAAIAAWSNRRNATASQPRHYEVTVAVRSSAGRWGQPQVLADDSVNQPYAGVAIGSGGAVATWQSPAGGAGTGAWAARRDSGGEWSDPERIAAISDAAFDASALAIAGDGTAAVYIQGGRPPALRQEPGGPWSPLAVTQRAPFAPVRMATDRAGRMVVARATAGGNPRIVVERPGGPIAAEVGRHSAPADVAVGADGTTAVVWVGHANRAAGRPVRAIVAVSEGSGR